GSPGLIFQPWVPSRKPGGLGVVAPEKLQGSWSGDTQIWPGDTQVRPWNTWIRSWDPGIRPWDPQNRLVWMQIQCPNSHLHLQLIMGRWVIKCNVEFRNNKLLCKCSVFTRICMITEGPNQDKHFYACGSGSKCGFLFWAEQPPDAEDDEAEPNNDGVEGNGSDFEQET
ncbi:hypothetical protein BS47DRAFT_1370173, partial [Hydnum rufescens UP504]